MKISTKLNEIIGNRSIYSFAAERGISHTTVYKMLNGEMDNPTPLVASRLCSIMNIQPKELMNFDFHPDESFIKATEEKLYELNIKENDGLDNFAESFYIFQKEYLIPVYKNRFSFDPFAYDNDFKPGPEATAYTNRKKEVDLIVFNILPNKIYKGKYPYHNIRDFINLLPMIMTTEGNIQLDKAIQNTGYNYTCKNSSFLFYTTSMTVYNELSKYKINFPTERNIGVVYCRFNRFPKIAILSGEKIIPYIE